ncbi:hypothetical protein CsSME_00053190 [Camellia sinensis var. sinensis]
MPVNPWTLFFIFSFLLFLIVPASGVNPQGESLLSWKRSLNGSPQALSNWDATDETPCGWFGISCNFNNEVEELNLRYVDLLGNVPSNFSSLMSLKKLVLSGTNLTGSIPKEMGKLRELTCLDLMRLATCSSLRSSISIQTGFRDRYRLKLGTSQA